MKEADIYSALRHTMVSEQIEQRGVHDPLVLKAMRKVPRHSFLPENLREKAYRDQAIMLGPEQSISQPYIVAVMLEALHLNSDMRVLDVGTGSGYQTALLAEIVKQVWTIEIEPNLAERSRVCLSKLGYKNIQFRIGDGSSGWTEEAPFDAIIVSAAAATVPRDLIRQLKIGARLVLPVGDDPQSLIAFEKTPQGLESEELGAVQFVPLKQKK